jgi:hypothetical protein
MITTQWILHFVYSDSLLLVNLLRAALFAFSILAIGLLLLGKSAVPARLWVYYFLCAMGLRLAVAPFNFHSESGWTGVDTCVCLAGVILFGGALLWAYSVRRSRRMNERLSGRPLNPRRAKREPAG